MQEKTAMVSVERLGVSQEETMEDPLVEGDLKQEPGTA